MTAWDAIKGIIYRWEMGKYCLNHGKMKLYNFTSSDRTRYDLPKESGFHREPR